jgi:translation initiation factor eIF-2B subunit delta
LQLLPLQLSHAHNAFGFSSSLQVTDGDVIMTFAYSHIVAMVLTEAALQGRDFHVVVVDCRPELEGSRMLEVGSSVTS